MSAIHSPHGMMRSICVRNSFFFVRTCASSSLRADRLICLSMRIVYHILACFALCGIALEQAFSAEYPEITDTGVSYAIRLSTLQVNTTKASNFVLQASMLYAAVVLMVICLTVLSLQQLLDASQYKYRFSVLRKLGVEDTHIGKLVLKQLGIWFGLPIVVAIIVSVIVIIYFIQTISAEIYAYIGFGTLTTQIGMTVSILALLLICYFISTWLLFKATPHK